MGELHILACKRHLEDLKRQGTKDFPYIWNTEKAEKQGKKQTEILHTALCLIHHR